MISVKAIAGSCLHIVLGLYNPEWSAKQDDFVKLLEFAQVDIPTVYVSQKCSDAVQAHNAQAWLRDITQEKFYTRAGNTKERWQAPLTQWIKKNPKEVCALFDKLSFREEVFLKIDEHRIVQEAIPADITNYRYLILGSSAPHGGKIIKFFFDKWQSFPSADQEVFLLTGARKANDIIDEDRIDGIIVSDNIRLAAQKFGKQKDEVMESHLMKNICDKEALDRKVNVTCKLVDTPTDEYGKRPTTITTFTQFLQDYNCKDSPSIIFGAAPFIYAQAEGIYKINNSSARGGCDLKFWGRPSTYEEAGISYGEPNYKLAANILANELAGSIYAGYARVDGLLGEIEYGNSPIDDL